MTALEKSVRKINYFLGVKYKHTIIHFPLLTSAYGIQKSNLFC